MGSPPSTRRSRTTAGITRFLPALRMVLPYEPPCSRRPQKRFTPCYTRIAHRVQALGALRRLAPPPHRATCHACVTPLWRAHAPHTFRVFLHHPHTRIQQGPTSPLHPRAPPHPPCRPRVIVRRESAERRNRITRCKRSIFKGLLLAKRAKVACSLRTFGEAQLSTGSS
jgi:hypothetical protein